MECLIKILWTHLSYKTKSASKATVTKWIVVDADGHNLGRLASKVAMILRGKCKTKLHTARWLWDNVTVINSEKTTVMDEKIYMSHRLPRRAKNFNCKVLQSKKNPLLEKSCKRIKATKKQNWCWTLEI
jgi:large subunit ribosomal protein L13